MKADEELEEDPTFKLSEIRAAFWEEFHKSGETFFTYLGTPEENTKCTETRWDSFLYELVKDNRGEVREQG